MMNYELRWVVRTAAVRHFKLAGVNWYGASDSFHVVAGAGLAGLALAAGRHEPLVSMEFSGSQNAAGSKRFEDCSKLLCSQCSLDIL